MGGRRMKKRRPKPTMTPAQALAAMRGSGLYGQPIVMRPGSDYALRSEPYISMEARR